MFAKQKVARHIFRGILILGFAALMVSCRSEPAPTETPIVQKTAMPDVTIVAPTVETIELPFETIEISDWPNDANKEPVYDQRLVLVNYQAELEQLTNHISSKALAHLSELNYEKYFVIAVFRGRRPTTGYDVEIERVVKQDDKIVVYTRFWELSPYYGVSEVETAPYHVVKVQRPAGVGRQFELLMQAILITPTPP